MNVCYFKTMDGWRTVLHYYPVPHTALNCNGSVWLVPGTVTQ